MSEPAGGAATLTDYEAAQVRAIAEWKSTPPNPFAEAVKAVTLPGAKALERWIPKKKVRRAIDRAYDASAALAGREDIKRRAGVGDLDELKRRPLEECDRLARRVGAEARAIGVAEGAATGAGGVFTTAIDVPLLFVLSVRTVLRTGHCYGEPLDRPGDRRLVLGVLLAATSGSLKVRRERLAWLTAVEDWLFEEAQSEILAEEALSFLFQLDLFGDLPGIGAVSGAALNLAFVRRVEITARRVFQSRWLRHNGKVDTIEPAEAHPRALAAGWNGVFGRAAHATAYAAGYGATLPVFLAASVFRSRNGRAPQAAPVPA